MRTLLKLLLLAALAVGGWLAWILYTPVTPPGQVFVLLRPGYSARRMARELKAAGVIQNVDAFIFWHYMHRQHSLKAGEYLFEKTASVMDVHARLAQGDIYVHTVVVPEGYNIFDIAQAVQDAGLGPGQDFLHVAMTDTSLISDLDPEAKSLEGYLFPSTYGFTRTQSMQDIATAMVRQFRFVAKDIGLASDIPKTVIIASIIEKETAVASERPLVASVYHNRLAKHIALQADPSVIYAELLKGTYGGVLRHEDLRVKSAYNTYRYPGLPPGAIANPGKSSLEAALHPSATELYYFVSDGNGHHRFSHGLEEHNRNVTAYRKVRKVH